MNEEYNYKRFKSSFYNLSEFPGPRAGEKFIDIELFNFEGEAVPLSSFLDKPLVIETGSVTCPMYAKCAPEMRKIKADFPDINFVLVYVREAHPGNKIGEHRSLHQKISISKSVKTIYKDDRTVLIDNIKGEFHQLYGLLPNFIYVINKEGVILFRGDWNDPEYTSDVLKSISTNKIYVKEHFKPSKPTAFVATKTLLNGGSLAMWDFLKELPGIIRLHKKASLPYKEKFEL